MQTLLPNVTKSFHDMMSPDQCRKILRQNASGFRLQAKLPRSSREYAAAIKPAVRYRLKTKLGDLFERADLLLSPSIARRAFVCGADQPSQSSYVSYTALFNNSGHCTASVPAGFYKGMPVGLQIIGRPGDEHLVLRAARALERERPWADKRPNLK